MKNRLRALGLCAALLLTPALLAAQDVIFRTDGARLRGKITSETSREVEIKTLGGVYRVPRDEIERIEREGDVFKTYERRRAALSSTDAPGAYALGIWAQDQGLHPQAIDCFHQALAADHDHEEARWELGYRRLNGRWVSEGEFFRARGYREWEDRWVSAEDYERYEQGLVKLDDGSWVPAAEAEAAEAKASAARAGAGRASGKARAGAQTKGSAADAGQAEAKRRAGFPWVGRNRPLGGQVGLPPLSKAERAAQLAQAQQQGSWTRALSSKYYDFYSNGEEPEVAKLARTLDLMCEEFQRIFKFEQEITRPFPVHLYGSQQEFMSRTGKGQGVGGFYDGSKIVAFHGTTGSLSTQSTLFHEGTHQFQGLVLGRNMWRAKIWLIEGLAVFFEACEPAGKRMRTNIIPKARLAHVRRAIRSGSYVRLHDLIRMEQREFGALHYAHAWSLIHFLVHGAKGGRKRFLEYWERTKTGGHDPVKSFEELFDKPIDEIEAAWKDYVLKLEP